jgi:hypothetical protein
MLMQPEGHIEAQALQPQHSFFLPSFKKAICLSAYTPVYMLILPQSFAGHRQASLMIPPVYEEEILHPHLRFGIPL